MCVATIAAHQQIEHAGFDHNARGAVAGELPQLVSEPLPAVNYRGHEIIDGLPLYRHRAFQPCDGIVPGRQFPAYRGRQPRIERIAFLLARVDESWLVPR